MSIVPDTDQLTANTPTAANAYKAERNLWQALLHGSKLKCPSCGKGKLLHSYLKVVDHCAECGESYEHHQADDAPPYFTILIVGHIVVPIMLAIEVGYWPPIWIQMIIWPLLTLILCLAFLPSVKGAVVAMQWAKYMHGFGERD